MAGSKSLPAPSHRRWKNAPAELIASFQSHECFFLAAGISFYFMLSLIPMLFLILDSALLSASSIMI